MLHYGFPLSRAESDFAAEHHDLIFSYLSQAGLPADDFYDIAVFGYLQAVRRYLARPELRRYGFSAVAFRAMGLSVRRSREYHPQQAELCPFDDELHTPDPTDTVAQACESALSFRALAEKLTGTQRRIALLRCEGYHDREIAAICRLTPREVELEMSRARANIDPFPMESAAAAA